MTNTKTVELSAGTVHYLDSGRGRPIIFLHGLVLNSEFWRKVAGPLSEDFRCVVPTLPLGGHATAMRADADLTPTGLADLIVEFVTALDLNDAVIVSNDTATALAQIVASQMPERIGAVVLTSGDAFDHFLPWQFRHLQWAARVPGAAHLVGRVMQRPVLRRSVLGFGLLTKHGIPDDVSAGYVRPLATDPGVRRDLTKVLRSISTTYTRDAAAGLRRCSRPVLLVWAEDDVLFPIGDARRLVDLLPEARLEVISDSRTYLPEDQPEKLVQLIRDFAGAEPTDLP